MESTMFTTTATTLSALSKTLNHSTTVAQITRAHLPLLHLRPTLPNNFASATPLFNLKNVGVGMPLFGHRLACVSSDVSSFASGGGGDGGGVYGGGGGGGDGDGAEVKRDSIAVGVDDVYDVSSDVIILDVGGMTCGGCCAKVKRILESQPLVSAATVNLTTETAIVWPVPEAKATPNWQRVLGEELAKHLTTCGFNSNFRDSIKGSVFPTFQSKVDGGWTLEQLLRLLLIDLADVIGFVPSEKPENAG